jgi:hypothetical protein
VCAALLPAAALGAGGLTTLDARHGTTARRSDTAATKVAKTSTPAPRHRVAAVHASPPPTATAAAVAVTPRAPARVTVTQPATTIQFVSGAGRRGARGAVADRAATATGSGDADAHHSARTTRRA